ncbi:hypothetical protein, partial [Burkholderia pseudomallei]|uniref:hypothetical protein n=1 Tax=Burkholderia pseudomallei TaxID=28450 RepID=UPI003CFA9512
VKHGRPSIVDMIKNGEIAMVFTTVDETRAAFADSRSIRMSAQAYKVTYYTTMSGAGAAIFASGRLVAFDTYGTVRDARGFTSST